MTPFTITQHLTSGSATQAHNIVSLMIVKCQQEQSEQEACRPPAGLCCLVLYYGLETVCFARCANLRDVDGWQALMATVLATTRSAERTGVHNLHARCWLRLLTP